MSHEYYLLGAMVVLALAYAIPQLLRVRAFRGAMLVTCPENKKPAAVKVSVWRAAMAAVLGRRHLELCNCSRWPERRDCPQDCICEIVGDPEGHRVWNVATEWFRGRACACCGKPITRLGHLDRRPALLDAQHKSVEWDAIPPEKLPEALWGSKPVCWNCHIADTFVREHPDLVTYRPWERSGPLGEYTPQKRDGQGTPTQHAA
ncbi:MAG TPA: hypothetical protein VL099_00170 [Candidatus Binatia bacterium]|nr:hypothetical protein [Candidatus Binatia bacterium]